MTDKNNIARRRSSMLRTATLLVLSASCSNAFAPVSFQKAVSRIASSTTRSPLNARPLQMMSSGMNNEEEPDSLKNPTPVAMQFLQEHLGGDVQKQALLPAALLAAMLTMAPLSADAAMSGGRMGGSYSSPRSGGYSRALPSRSSYSSRSYYGGGGYSRPNVIVAPTITPFYNPFYSPFATPFGGAGVVSYRSGGFGFGGLAFLGFGAFALATILPSILAPSRTVSSWSSSDETDAPGTSALGPGTSVAQISVALQVPNRSSPNSILSVLDRLARTARTDSRVGIQQLTSQVALELLRRKSSISSATTSFQHFRGRTQAQREYERVSIRERSKFEQETVSKYGGVDYASSSSSSRSSTAGGSSADATMAVVTLVLAIDGDSTKLPTIRSIGDVEEALRMIASDAKVDDCLQSAEILWTPEDPSESLSPRDIVADYPTLRSV